MCVTLFLKTPAKFANIHLISKQIAIKMQLPPSFLTEAAFLFTTDRYPLVIKRNALDFVGM